MSKLPQRFEWRLVIMTMAALLFAQLGAITHAYSHDAAGSPFSSTHRTGLTNHDPCNDCRAFAPLLSAAGTTTALPLVEPQCHGLATTAVATSLLDRSLILAFRSRAPPRLT